MNHALLSNSHWKQILAAALVLFLFVTLSLRTQSRQDAKETKLDAKDQAEWASAGFKIGWMNVKDAGNTVFDEKQIVGAIPAFRYSRHYKGENLATLPVISVPFGLFLDDSPVDDMFLEGLSRFQQVRFLCVRFGPITDTGMKEIAKLKNVTHLEVSSIGNRANADDATQTKEFNGGVKLLAALPKVTVLNLSETRIGDDGIKHLAEMKHLRILNLRGTMITDSGLESLFRLNEITTLDVRDTRITMEGVERLKKALPKATVLFGSGK